LKHSRLFGILSLLWCVACMGFAQESPVTPSPMPTNIPSATATIVPIDGAIGPQFAPNINPLTGLVVADAGVLARRPIVVKISNSPSLVRPQAGIGEADVVFEHYTEVGITRFSAIFYANAPTRVGSLRSARLIDYELAPMYGALLAFAGASIGVDKKIYGSQAIIAQLCANRPDQEQCNQEANAIGPVGDVPPSDFVDRAYKGVLFGAPYFYRDENIPVPHNFFVDLQALWQLAESNGNGGKPDLRGMVFHDTPPPNETGSGVLAQVRYATTLAEWYYDPQTNQYYRSSDGQTHFDANTNQQIRADNVIILYAGHYLTDIVESSYQDTVHWSEQITLWSVGKMILLRDGKRYEGVWQRPTRDSMLTFWTNDGNYLYLKTGITWIQVVRLPEQMNPDTEWVHVE
jgi:hypothetical protein